MDAEGYVPRSGRRPSEMDTDDNCRRLRRRDTCDEMERKRQFVCADLFDPLFGGLCRRQSAFRSY